MGDGGFHDDAKAPCAEEPVWVSEPFSLVGVETIAGSSASKRVSVSIGDPGASGTKVSRVSLVSS
jgi:hypothetical protein